ncbi:MAG: excinuclease ABC subunit UvrA, partial [Clostridiales bacterium]|nr:excinuclease ABC subunit UvrA [Clostridiales bacterium]
MNKNKITIKGARVHNLKNVDLEIPRNKLVVLTGISGSGKSSLAFDTIYAEGQRRYVESLSAYARQFLGLMDKPDVDLIEGLSPAISIDQKTTSRNPRSTVGTVTEIYDYLRLMYARIGIPHCPECGKEILQQTVDQMVDVVMSLDEGTRIQLLAPIVRGKKGEHARLLDKARRDGFVRMRVDGEIRDLSEDIRLEKTKKHTLETVVDRLIVKAGIEQRLTDSLETVLGLTGGLAVVNVLGGQDLVFNQNYACPDCNISIEELSPRMFSFNNPYGACDQCTGLGMLMEIDKDLVLVDRSLSLKEGAISAPGWNIQNGDSMGRMYLEALAKHYGFSLDQPVEDLDQGIIDLILYGTGGQQIKVSYDRENGSGTFKTAFEGIITNMERRYSQTQSRGVKEEIEAYMVNSTCPKCQGTRLKAEVRAVTVGGLNIDQFTQLSIGQALDFIEGLKLSDKHKMIASQIIKEIRARLSFLLNVGLDYLTLARPAGTLSGGEAQRIRLATQIGSGLVGVLYVLDEPSIGLHQRDNSRLIKTLRDLRDQGNTVIVVEHDDDTMLASDFLIDIGPGAGIHGGQIVAAAPPKELMKNKASITGQYLSGKKRIELPKERRKAGKKWLTVVGASENNLKNIDVKIPISLITCITGVSGSGKSSLVNEIIYKSLARDLNRAKTRPGSYKEIKGLKYLDKVINIDQSPIGRTPRSNPATYTGVFD